MFEKSFQTCILPAAKYATIGRYEVLLLLSGQLHLRLCNFKWCWIIHFLKLIHNFCFSQNCASSRPSSSVTSSRPVSFPLGTSPSQEEETTPTEIISTNQGSGKEEEKTRGGFMTNTLQPKGKLALDTIHN